MTSTHDIFPLATVTPIPAPRHRLGIAETLDSILSDNGWSARLGEPWLTAEQGDLPLLALHAGVQGPDLDAAVMQAELLASLVADVITLHRGAPANPLVTVVEATSGLPGARQFRVSSHSRPYPGNLLGGVAAGESAAAIATDIAAASQDNLSMLWLRMAREARTERNPDFAVFRWWSLLESIVEANPAPVSVLTDFSGTPIDKDDGNPVSGESTQGRVFEFLKGYYRANNIHESAFVMNPPFGTLWETVFAWYGLRNAVAHYGRFDPANDKQQGWWWFPFLEAARRHELGLAPGGAAAMLLSLRDLTAMVLRSEIHRRGGLSR